MFFVVVLPFEPVMPTTCSVAAGTHLGHDEAREVRESGHGIRNHDLGDGCLDGPLDDREDRAALDGGVDEQVSVGLFAGLGDEDAACLDESGIRVDGSRDDGVGTIAGEESQVTADSLGERTEGKGDHRVSPWSGASRLSPVWGAAWARSWKEAPDMS